MESRRQQNEEVAGRRMRFVRVLRYTPFVKGTVAMGTARATWESLSLGMVVAVFLLTANRFDYFTLNAGTAPPFSMNVHLPSAHTRFSISIRFNWTYCSGDRPIAWR